MEDTKFRMMPGSTTGNTYLLIGRHGKFALGIKPVAVMRGDAFGVPGHTWFGSKLRSAPADASLFEGFENKVVKLQSQPATPWDAWPMVEWENKSQSRASTTIGIMLKGAPDGEPESAQALLDEIRNDLGMKMAEYLYGLVGEEAMLLFKGEIAEWFDGHFGKIADSIEKAISTRKKVAAAMSENVGFFAQQAAILKKLHATQTGSAVADEDDDTEDDEDETDED